MSTTYLRPKVLPSELVDQGWWQDRGKGHPPGLECLLSALHKVTLENGPYGAEYPPYSEYYKALRRRLDGQSPAKWNDAPERTKAEVVALGQAVEREDMGWL